MLVHIPNVLDAATLAIAREQLRLLEYDDGSRTAGWHARAVKHNAQARPSPALGLLQSVIVEALAANPLFGALVLPHRIAPPLISRCGPGQSYGRHVDDAIMGGSAPLRTDVSVTVFLSDPDAYEGGGLVVETLAGEDEAKFAAGDAVVYPSTTLHRVDTVVSGERIVAATWAQSRVRDAAHREVLFDLDRARRMIFEKDGKCEAFDLVTSSYSNLLRSWAEV